MSKAQYVLTPTDPAFPFGEAQSKRIGEAFDAFLADPNKRVLSLTEPVDIYHFENGVMRKIGSQHGTPCQIDEETMLVPITEKTEDYSYSGYELWKKADGEWARVESSREQASA